MQEVEDTQERVSVGRAVSRDKEIVTIEKARTVKRTIERTRRGSRRQTDVQAVADEVAQSNAATLPRTESLPIGSQELDEEPEEEKKEEESPSKRVTRSSKKIAVRQDEGQEAKVQEQEEGHEEEVPMEQEEVPMEQDETGEQQQQQGEEEEEETQMEEEAGAGARATEEEEQPEQPPQPSPRKTTMSKKDVPPRTPRGKKAPTKATAAKKTKAKAQDTKAKRARNKRKRSIDDMDPFDTYIHKVLKQVHPECRLSKKSVELINDFLADIYEKVTHECKTLCERTGRKTLSSREVQTAVRLTLPGELAKHAVSEGTKAVSYAMA